MATPSAKLRVEIDAVALWEPMPHAQKGTKGVKKVAGLTIQSWDFRPSEHEGPIELVVTQPAMFFSLQDGTPALVANELEWKVVADYVETREFDDGDGSPRPKHFFALKVPKGLEDRLRQSPADILAQSDLVELPETPKK